mmetsp:Transcript_23247/g.40024  ORF Transcript_23247/g.40024 Transcript_23247/m.40024 type:complete len:315 (+) Transcript_23247:9551-10495(+)
MVRGAQRSSAAGVVDQATHLFVRHVVVGPAIDDKAGRRRDPMLCRVLLIPGDQRAQVVPILQTRLNRVPAQTRQTTDLAQFFDDGRWIAATGTGPLGLPCIKQIGDAKKLLGARTARNRRGPDAKAIKIDFAIDKVDQPGVDVIGLELLIRPSMEPPTMGTGITGILNDRDGRVGVTDRHFNHGRCVDVTGCLLGICGPQKGDGLRIIKRVGRCRAVPKIACDPDGNGHHGKNTVHVRVPCFSFVRMFAPSRSRASRNVSSATGATTVDAARCIAASGVLGPVSFGLWSKATRPSENPVDAVCVIRMRAMALKP